MNKLQELITELNNLPQGYISKKHINGNEYYYYQENKPKTSRYIKQSELELLTQQIERRKEILSEINKFERSGRDLTKPSLRSQDLTGNLMMEDITVASFEKGIPTFIDKELAPLLISRTGNIRAFLASRAIDRTRTHSRLLKKYLGIKDVEDAAVSIYSYGASITDNYWFKAKGSKLKYNDISFKYDFYSDLVLKGDVGYLPRSPKYTPQLTLTGSYEKCWKLIGDDWYLYKQGSSEEIFSELVCSKLASKLGIPTAQYEYADGYIRTKNIADKYNLEPIFSIAGDDDSFENVFSAILNISEEIAVQYLTLILFDFIVYNVDRHNENCGLFRDKKTGEIISLAPNYDNNIALTAVTTNLYFNPNRDGMANFIKKFLKDTPDALRLIKLVHLAPLTGNDLKEIFDSIEIKRDENLLTSFILDRYNYVLSLIKYRNPD